MSGYYIVPARHTHTAVNRKQKRLLTHGGNYALCTAAVSLRHTAFFQVPCSSLHDSHSQEQSLL